MLSESGPSFGSVTGQAHWQAGSDGVRTWLEARLGAVGTQDGVPPTLALGRNNRIGFLNAAGSRLGLDTRPSLATVTSESLEH